MAQSYNKNQYSTQQKLQPAQQPFRSYVQQYLQQSMIRGTIPQRNINTENTKELFTIISTGDLNIIRNIISNKNISLNVKNDLGQGLISTVLENTSLLKEDEKYEIVKYLIDHGAPITVYDKYNVTPLHLACKYQYESIVKLLLDNGADPDVSDSLHMTPLHYAAQGNIQNCKKSKKIGSLIPKDSIKNTEIEIKELTLVIMDLLSTTYFKIYLKHIKNTLQNINSIYFFDFEKNEMDFFKNITDILSDNYITNIEKQERIKNRIVSMKNTLNKISLDKLNKTFKSLSIGPHNVNGWSPGPGTDAIMPKIIENYSNILQSSFKSDIQRLEASFTDIIEKIHNHVNKINTTGINIYSNIHNIIYLNRAADFNKNVINNENKKNRYVSHFQSSHCENKTT